MARRAQPSDLGLLETLLWEPGRGYRLLTRHLDRLERSARHFGIPVDRTAVAERLRCHGSQLADASGARKVRLVVSAEGNLEVTDEPRGFVGRVSLIWARKPVSSKDPLLQHKTTRRETYEAALRARPPGADDVLLWNERGEVTETCSCNLVAEIDGELLTPHRAAGLLPGTFREELLAQGRIREARLTRAEVAGAERLLVINAVRGWREARLG